MSACVNETVFMKHLTPDTGPRNHNHDLLCLFTSLIRQRQVPISIHQENLNNSYVQLQRKMIHAAIGKRTSIALLKRDVSGLTKSIGKSRQAGGVVTRNISIGTDLTDSDITLQKARPWVSFLFHSFCSKSFIASLF